MPRKAGFVPKYRHFKPRNLAVVRIDGQDHYLGLFGSDESYERYARLIAQWKTAQPNELPPGSISVNEVILAFWTHAKTYYVKGNRPTKEVSCIREALRPVKQLFGETPANGFGPSCLRLVLEKMVDNGWCRGTINRHLSRIKRMFRWAVEHELVPAVVHHGLSAVRGLRLGRSPARETLPVTSVPSELVEKILPHVSAAIAAMIRLQLYAGMRPGEVVLLRNSDLDRNAAVWQFTPLSHKTEHFGRPRVIFLGPKAQDILRPWLHSCGEDAFLFSRQPGLSGNSPYSTSSYYHAIARACRRANVPIWGPNRLRHSCATEIRQRYGLEASQVVLGHTECRVTQVYAERDWKLAEKVMQELG